MTFRTMGSLTSASNEADSARADAGIEAVAFDLGGVLIDWNARYLYRSLLPNESAIDAFLAEVGFTTWNIALDAGRDWDEAVEWLATRHPDRRQLIAAFRDRWEETIGGPIVPVVEIVDELRAAGLRTFALSNWSRRTYDIAAPRFPFLERFEAVVISGDVGLTKPDPGIYRELLRVGGLLPERTIFVDDTPGNVEAAERLGILGIVFTDPAALRRDLAAHGLPIGPAPKDIQRIAG
jgi:2-haloacid dehalogenase